jgi:hypothetical protein
VVVAVVAPPEAAPHRRFRRRSVVPLLPLFWGLLGSACCCDPSIEDAIISILLLLFLSCHGGFSFYKMLSVVSQGWDVGVVIPYIISRRWGVAVLGLILRGSITYYSILSVCPWTVKEGSEEP